VIGILPSLIPPLGKQSKNKKRRATPKVLTLGMGMPLKNKLF